MPNYRRARVSGASYFFTVNLASRRSDLLVTHIHELRAAYAATIRDMPVICDAMVVLPDHLHAVWTLPPGDCDFSERWRKIKHRFSRNLGGVVGRTAHRYGFVGEQACKTRVWYLAKAVLGACDPQ